MRSAVKDERADTAPARRPINRNPMQFCVLLRLGSRIGQPGAVNPARIVLIRRKRHGIHGDKLPERVFHHMSGAVFDAVRQTASRGYFLYFPSSFELRIRLVRFIKSNVCTRLKSSMVAGRLLVTKHRCTASRHRRGPARKPAPRRPQRRPQPAQGQLSV